MSDTERTTIATADTFGSVVCDGSRREGKGVRPVALWRSTCLPALDVPLPTDLHLCRHARARAQALRLCRFTLVRCSGAQPEVS